MDRDFAPSLLFVCLYVVATSVGFYRMSKRESRSLFVAMSLAFTMERYDGTTWQSCFQFTSCAV